MKGKTLFLQEVILPLPMYPYVLGNFITSRSKKFPSYPQCQEGVKLLVHCQDNCLKPYYLYAY